MSGMISKGSMDKCEVTEKVCPMATTGVTGCGTFFIYHNCIGESCQMWNLKRKDCGLKHPDKEEPK
jgi:hypothetical protein